MLLDTTDVSACLDAVHAADAADHLSGPQGVAIALRLSLELSNLAALVAELRHERDEAEAQRDAAIQRAAQHDDCDDEHFFGPLAIAAQAERAVAVMPHERDGRCL